MMKEHTISRRNFLGMTAGFGAFAAMSNLNSAQAQTAPGDYKALVCVFLFGGNDGHNTVVPLSGGEYAAYQSLRGGLALPTNELLPISAGSVPYGLHYGLPELRNLYTQGKMAIVSNVGNIVKPTSKNDLTQLPTQLFSHSDQVGQMQSGAPDGSLGTGWGGRTADVMQPSNTNSNFPPSISFNGASLFSTCGQVQSASLQPGNNLSQYALSVYPPAAANARAQAQREIISAASGFNLVNRANKAVSDALDLNALLVNAGGVNITTPFPGTTIGQQLREAARIINLRASVGISRQVFFCGLGGFDTHGTQRYTQWDLLQQTSQAMSAFYTATEEMGIAGQVTTFTTSDFGRTLQPSGSGSDHGWGAHHFVLGGAVRGGMIHGSFPSMSLSAQHFLDNRGILIPTTSLSQYGATLAKWFGAADIQLNTIFPTLTNFPVRDVGFML